MVSALRAALLKGDGKSVFVTGDLSYRAPQQHSAACAELCLEAAMHLDGKPMAMRIPEWAKVPQEARLLFRRQSLPDVLHRGTKAIDDGLPWGAAVLSHLAG